MYEIQFIHPPLRFEKSVTLIDLLAARPLAQPGTPCWLSQQALTTNSVSFCVHRKLLQDRVSCSLPEQPAAAQSAASTLLTHREYRLSWAAMDESCPPTCRI